MIAPAEGGVINDIDGVFTLDESAEDALRIGQVTTEAAQRTQNSELGAWGLIKTADAHAMLGDLDAAMAEVQQAQSLCKEHRLEEARGAMMNVATKIHLLQGEIDNAMSEANDALKLFTKLGYKKGMVASLVTQANVYFNKDEPDEAIKKGQDALTISQEIGDPRAQAAVYSTLMSGYMQKHDTKRAAQMMRKAVNIYKSSNERRKEANAWQSIATVEFTGGDHSKATKAANIASSLFKQLGDVDGQAFCLTTMMDILLAAGNYFDALTCAKDKVKLLDAAGNKKAAAAALLLLASTLHEHNDNEAAEHVAGKAWEKAMEASDKDGVAAAQTAMAEAKKARVAARIKAEIMDSSDYQHIPSKLIVDPGRNRRIQEEYAEFVKA